MKLYMHPASAPSRAVMLFAAQENIPLQTHVVDLMTGAQHAPEYGKLNPNRLVPVLDDDGFVLTESTAILRYLAGKSGSDMYPAGLMERARVDEALAWFNGNFYRDYGYNLVYAQLFPHHARRSDEGTKATVSWGRQRSRHWLSLLDEHLIGPQKDFLCLDRLTIADCFGASLVTLGEAIQNDLSAYPNISRWIANMKALPGWEPVNAGFNGMVESLKEQSFIAA
ncbi:glutathione S-transferase family protein [Roseibium aggregatum]|uniref:Glutathione S-transferase family protein n=1 Tax=Roseibium aggregatum TaxID=187304 RepID=A0A926S891_9HYPH|nr:glutathione S-transferase family protein [Roseibium aggregatum]MBD1549205.1 glutathione S-transferase family protein [Roseibium aggregatum]